MNDIRPALRTFLLADAAVSALVGGSRIHYSRLPQGQVEPSVVYNRVSELPNYTMSGDAHLLGTRMQFDSWAQTAGASDQLARAVHDRLSGAKGEMQGDAGPILVGGVFSFIARDDFDAVANMHRVSRDYVVWYQS